MGATDDFSEASSGLYTDFQKDFKRQFVAPMRL
jgi:hypothetical protein